jgi:hypothetical protein
LGDALMAFKGKTAIGRYLGIAAIFTWLALIFYNMTQDSLAIPNLWINLGILVGLSTLYDSNLAKRINSDPAEAII